MFSLSKHEELKGLHTLSTDVARYVQKHHSIQAEQQKRDQENKCNLCLSDDDISRLDTAFAHVPSSLGF